MERIRKFLIESKQLVEEKEKGKLSMRELICPFQMIELGFNSRKFDFYLPQFDLK
jgi:hypothetical protein